MSENYMDPSEWERVYGKANRLHRAEIDSLLADKEALVRYVRAVTSWANEQMDIFKERDVMKKREYEESYDALSQELREEINE